MPELTHDQMAAVVAAGGAVVWQGRIIHRAPDVPSDEAIAAAAALAAQNPFLGPPGTTGAPGPSGLSGLALAIWDPQGRLVLDHSRHLITTE